MIDKILVTGSTGFVGQHLVKKLIDLNYSVLEITRNKKKSNQLFNKCTTKLSLDDENFSCKVLEFNPRIVIHLASYLTSSDELNEIEKLINSNIIFLTKLLNVVSKLNLNLFVNTGTFAEFKDGKDIYKPAYLYAATKTATRYILDYYSNTYCFNHCTVVPYTIYGGIDSSKKIIDLIIESMNVDNKLDLSPGDQILDFIHVEDVVSFYIHLIENFSKIPNQSNFNLGTGKGHSLKQIASLLEIISNKKTNINWGGKDYRKSDIMYAVANLEHINKIFDWKPKISLEEGLSKMIK
jgi:nucleoside-diphosphate-sugar epimerase